MKKGFTLIEVILSIVLIVVVMVSSTVSLNYINKKNKEETLEKMSNTIYEAVHVYVESNSEIKKKLYENKEGIIIPLTTLENTGLVDFKDIKLDDEKDYIITMLGSDVEGTDYCAETYTTTSWNIKDGETIYICEKTNTEIEILYEKINNLEEQIKDLTNGSNAILPTQNYVATGKNPNNYVEFAVNSNTSEVAYFPNDSEKNLWRIISIDEENKIKLIYNKPVKSNNQKNYTTSDTITCCNYDVTDESSCTYYPLKHSAEGSGYFRYDNNVGFATSEILDEVTTPNSKKKALFDSIVNNNWIISEKYYPYYSLTEDEMNFHDLKLNNSESLNLKMGFLNPNEIVASYTSGSWLYNYNMLIGKMDEDANFNDYYLTINSTQGTIDFAYKRISQKTYRNRSGGKSYTCGGWFLSTGNYYPVIALKSNVKLVTPNCETGVSKGSKECPYKLSCESC